MAVQRCALALGDDPWDRLSAGRIAGTLAWNDQPAQDVLVRIRGAHSRRFPKKSLQVDFPDEPLRDEPPEGHVVRRIHLNADYVDPTLMRSALSYGLFAQAGVPAPLCRHAEVAVNGAFAGLYVTLESVDSDFLRRRHWAPGPIYYAVNRDANFGLLSPFSRQVKQSLDQGYQAVHKADTGPLRRMLMEVNLASDRAFPAVVERWIDVPGYLRWLLVSVFIGNRDGFVHNYALYRDGGSGHFRIIPWDCDATWGIDINGKPARLDRVPMTGWNKLTYRLLATTAYRHLYKNLFRQAFDTFLDSTDLAGEIDKLSRAIEPWIDKNCQRHGCQTRFEVAVATLRRWAEERRALLLRELAYL